MIYKLDLSVAVTSSVSLVFLSIRRSLIIFMFIKRM